MSKDAIKKSTQSTSSPLLSSGLLKVLKNKVLKPLLNERSIPPPVRVWVIGCSTGLAAYAVSLSFLELLEEMSLNIPIKIFVTDIDEKNINYARAGIYAESEMLNFSTQRQQRFFRKVAAGYKINETVRNNCVFGKHNLIQDPSLLHLDLIVCCKSLVELDTNEQKRIMSKFHQAIEQPGFMIFLGSNGIDVPTDLFNSVDDRYRIFVKGPLSTAEIDETQSIDYLQSVIEEYRVKYESLQENREDSTCLQEELQVTNEELFSKNEELIFLVQDLEKRNRELAEAKKAAEEVNRLKDEFLAIISHELRTPLTAIIGWLRLIQKDNPESGNFSHAINVIDRNAKIQKRLIEDLLDLSIIISGKLSLDMKPVEIIPVIQDVIDTIQPTAKAKNIEIEIELKTNSEAVFGDPTRLQQIIWNLLNNAIKFSYEGGKVRLRLAQSKSNTEITIIDEGQGISPNLMPHIFDSFRQGDSSITRQHGGLGLGLTITRHLVEAHGGRLVAESDGEGRGTSLKVILPVMEEKNHKDTKTQRF
jgi:signal transduction histidine kinase